MITSLKLRKILVITLMAIAVITTAVIYMPKADSYAALGLNIINDGGAIVLATGDFDETKIQSTKDLTKFMKGNAKRLGIKSPKALALAGAHDSAFGTVYRMQQYYDGIEVYGRQMNVAVDINGTPLNLSGNYLVNAKPQNKIKLKVEDIQLKLKGFDIYSIKLIIYTHKGSPTYAYMADTNINGKSISFYDAQDCELIERIATNADIISEQTNAKNEKVNIDVAESGNKYYLTDELRNIAIYDYSKNSASGSPLVGWTVGSQLSDKIAVSVYDYLVKTYDFYTDANNIGVSRMGINDDHDKISGNKEEKNEYFLSTFIHYYPNGTPNYENASYSDNITNSGEVLIGDGRAGGLYQLGKSFDVLSHEYQHGITSRTADLIYFNQSGAINEAISDIFAVMIGDTPLDDDNAWLIGEDIVTNGAKALRDMKNPLSLKDPIKVNGDNYKPECHIVHNHVTARCDNGGVHTNSSIINNVAYNIYKSDVQYFTKQRMATLWYSTLLGLPSDSSYKVLSANLLQTAKNLNYSDEHILNIKQAFNDANIDEYSSISFAKGNDKIIGTVPSAISCMAAVTFTLPKSDITLEGHNLIGWGEKNSSGEFTKLYYFDKEYDTPKNSIILYPIMAISAMDNNQLVPLSKIGNAYVISTPQELMSLAYYINNYEILDNDVAIDMRKNGGVIGNVSLGANIDMSKISGSFIPINLQNDEMKIYLDGKGYRISGVDILADKNHPTVNGQLVGLFTRLYGSVTRLGLDIKISTDDSIKRIIGGLTAVNYANISIVDTVVDINITGIENQKIVVGGIAGTSYQTLQDCAVSGQILADCAWSIVGGLIGNSLDDTISINVASDNQGTITGRANLALVVNSVADVRLVGDTVGGVIGEMSVGKIVNVIAKGDISATSYGGGAIGRVSDWWQSGGGGTSTNTAMNVISADIYLMGIHVSNVINSPVAGSMIGQYEKQGYAVVLESVYNNSNIDVTIAAANSDILIGEMKIGTDINYSMDSTYENNRYFVTASQGNIFAMGTVWVIENSQLKLNIGVKNWIDDAQNDTLEGDGSKLNPLKIANARQLAALANGYYSRDYGKSKMIYVKQIGDIDLSGKIWQSIGFSLVKNDANENSANIHYDGNGYTIAGMVARERHFAIERLNRQVEAKAYAALVHGYTSVIEKVNVIQCNNAGEVASGIATQANKLAYCTASGNISAQADAGGIAVKADEILYCNVTARLGGANVGGVAVGVELNMIGNYAKVDITAIDGKAFRQNAAGGLVSMTVDGTKVGLVNISNNYADVTIKALSRIGNYGGAIGTVTDSVKASFTMQRNVIKSEVINIMTDSEYCSVGALIGGGNMFTKVGYEVEFIPKIMDNVVISDDVAIGNRTNIDIISELKDIDTIKYEYGKAVNCDILSSVVKNKQALAMLTARAGGGYVAYMIKDGEIVDIVALKDGKFVYDKNWEIPEGKEFKYWARLGSGVDVSGQVFNSDIFVEQKIGDKELPKIEPTSENNKSVTKIVLITVGAVSLALAIGAITLIIVVRKRKI